MLFATHFTSVIQCMLNVIFNKNLIQMANMHIKLWKCHFWMFCEGNVQFFMFYLGYVNVRENSDGMFHLKLFENVPFECFLKVLKQVVVMLKKG